MIIDEQARKTNDEEIIEVLIGNKKAKVWIPVRATSLYIVNKNQELNKVEAVRLRKFGEPEPEN